MQQLLRAKYLLKKTPHKADRISLANDCQNYLLQKISIF